MLKYGDFLTETLAAEIKAEPRSAAARQAKKMGLTYVGFGRYTDKKGKVAYIVDDDKLVPYKGKEISKLYDKSFFEDEKGGEASKQLNQLSKVQRKRNTEDNRILKTKKKEIAATHRELQKFYNYRTFTDDELSAIGDYTRDGYAYVNRYLYKGHDEGVDNSTDQQVNATIAGLDSAFEGSEAPFKYNVYTGLSDRYKAEKIKPGMDYIFRGYLSTSLDYNTAIDGFTNSEKPVVLQIEVNKGQKAIYVDAVSGVDGEQETILPRGSRIRVVSGPHPLSMSVLSGGFDDDEYEGNTIQLFICKLVEDK